MVTSTSPPATAIAAETVRRTRTRCCAFAAHDWTRSPPVEARVLVPDERVARRVGAEARLVLLGRSLRWLLSLRGLRGLRRRHGWLIEHRAGARPRDGSGRKRLGTRGGYSLRA